MRLSKTIFLIVWVLVLHGCYSEVYDKCKEDNPYNVELTFRMSDNDRQLLGNISSVVTLVFDSDERFVMLKNVTESDLHDFAGIRFQLDPGEYILACWGNITGDNTDLRYPSSGGTREAAITYSNIDGGVAGNGDMIYFGPLSSNTRSDGYTGFPLRVENENKTTHGTIGFTHAYRTISINVAGFIGIDGGHFPDVQLNNVPLGTSFFGMELLKDGQGNIQTVNTRQGTAKTIQAGEEYASVDFNTFQFDLGSPVTINIIDPTSGTLIHARSLPEILEEINYTDTGDINIPLVFRFVGSDVHISLPTWDVETPGIGLGR